MSDKDISDFLLGLGTWRAVGRLWGAATLPLIGCLLALRIERPWLSALIVAPLAFLFVGGFLALLISGFLILLRYAL